MFLSKIISSFKGNQLLLLIKIYALSVSTFFIFRLFLFLSEMNRVAIISDSIFNIFKAFLMGIRFDIVMTGYIVLLPSLLLMICFIIGTKCRVISKILFYYLFSIFTISFLISSADIPYFNHFFKRFDIDAFKWIDNPIFVLRMIVGEPRYILILIPYVFIIYFFYKSLRKIFKTYETSNYSVNINIFVKIFISLVVLFIILVGIRGRIQKKSPIRVGTAYFCHDPFLNQLGLNPVFTFLRSFVDSLDPENETINLLDKQIAIDNVKNYLKINKELEYSPIAREISPDTICTNKANVIIVMMESMSTAKMKRYGNKNNITPFLDSLSNKSYFFENIYTAGEHTFNGIFSTLFSFPALYRQHTMKKIRKYMGISYTLKKLGYSTTYFTTHDGQFDNIEGFLRANDYDNIITQSDYPMKEIKSALGVPDDYMFRFSIPIINKLHQTGKPFFVALMTTSDHGPYHIPPYFKANSTDIRKQITEYADWSLRRFIELAKKTKWFKNTFFVFIADHGEPINVKYPISLNYHHTPLLIYAPKILSSKVFKRIGSQIDVYPSIMGLLKQPYINNTLGIDLVNKKRPYAIINGDDKVAVLDNEFLFVLMNRKKALFRYKEKRSENDVSNFPEKVKKMEIYLRSNLQVYQHMLNNEQIDKGKN